MTDNLMKNVMLKGLQEFHAQLRGETMEKPRIIDDGTMDTVVLYRGTEHRFSTEYRNEFDDDDTFLSSIADELWEYENE